VAHAGPTEIAEPEAQCEPLVVTGTDVTARVRAICLALPGTRERPSHGTPAFFVKKQFAIVWPEGHHDRHFPQLWCAAPLGAQDAFVSMAPGRFFRPPYVGPRGWLGLRLDGAVDWDEVAALCEDGHQAVTS
jgi:YjbR